MSVNKVHSVPVWLPPIETVSVLLLQSFVKTWNNKRTLPVPVWCRCHCATPGRVPHSKYKAELRHPETVRKACLDWTSGPWMRHSSQRMTFISSTLSGLTQTTRQHRSYPYVYVVTYTQWKHHHTNPKVPLYSHAPPIWPWFFLMMNAELRRGTGTNLGSPSVSWRRCSLSSISWVGPPPPSPWPNNTALWLALPLSLLFFTVFTSCRQIRARGKKALWVWSLFADSTFTEMCVLSNTKQTTKKLTSLTLPCIS